MNLVFVVILAALALFYLSLCKAAGKPTPEPPERH
jgi:hypothetical protein